MNRLSCWLIRKRMVEYLCGELSGEKGRRVASHLETCPDCRKVWEGMKMTADVIKDLPLPEPPGAFWDFYAKRVTARISENPRRHPIEGFYGFKKILIPVVSFLLFVSISLGGTRSYLIEKEITRNHELYQNVETIWNLDLIDPWIQDEVLFSEPIDQSSQAETPAFSKGEIRQQFHKFRRLPVSERNLILANYQKWTGYTKERQIVSKQVHHILQATNHPALKKLK
ncbi:MAG: zf-HC2 domain-containing protein [Candidatus Omnitrophica bacterium]|nr:zf-HC2 domain-containing protein [Candidatus Omnitrophota bacterium]